MLPTWRGRTTSINVYLASDRTSESRRKKRARSDFDLCKYLAGKSCFFFLKALPRPRRFFPEARSRHTTAMDGFIWRSPSPPPRSTLGENACNRTEYQSKARWSGRAAARASISGIPTVTLWSLPRLDCGRSIDEKGRYAFGAWVRSCRVTVRAVFLIPMSAMVISGPHIPTLICPLCAKKETSGAICAGPARKPKLGSGKRHCEKKIGTGIGTEQDGTMRVCAVSPGHAEVRKSQKAGLNGTRQDFASRPHSV